MLQFEIKGIPVPWSAHKGYGRRAFNPRFKEKEFYQWQIRSHCNREKPISGPVRLQVVYHMPIPKATSGVKRRQMLNGVLHHISRPDLSDLSEFLIEALQGIVFSSKYQIYDFHSKKIYSEISKVVVSVDYSE